MLGVDGCRAGWFVVRATVVDDPAECGLSGMLVERFADVLELRPAAKFVAVDMPIGLPAVRRVGGRECERLARAALGPRKSSVFSTPARRVLHARKWAEVRGEGLSKQAFHLLPKIREVDAVITPARQRRVRETHPELAFCRLAGHPMRHRKRTALGHAERRAVLRRVFPPRAVAAVVRAAAASHRRSEVAPDDVLDALVLAAAARRMCHREAVCLPARPPRDPRGLAMAIWS